MASTNSIASTGRMTSIYSVASTGVESQAQMHAESMRTLPNQRDYIVLNLSYLVPSPAITTTTSPPSARTTLQCQCPRNSCFASDEWRQQPIFDNLYSLLLRTRYITLMKVSNTQKTGYLTTRTTLENKQGNV